MISRKYPRGKRHVNRYSHERPTFDLRRARGRFTTQSSCDACHQAAFHRIAWRTSRARGPAAVARYLWGGHRTRIPASRKLPANRSNLTAKLRADYDALQNDVQQARELAADFQRQLAGKSNEFADLKRVFSETRSHLTRLEASITELREERHRLASEAMRGVAFERKLAEKEQQVAQLEERVSKLREERHRFAADAMRATALERKLVERDAEIAQLTTDLANLREQLARGKARTPEPEPTAGWRGLFTKKK